MNMKDAYQEKLEAEMREWNAKIDELKAKADKAKAEVKIEYYEQIQELHSKQAVVQAKMRALSDSGEEALEELKSGVEHAWSDLKSSLEKAVSKFN